MRHRTTPLVAILMAATVSASESRAPELKGIYLGQTRDEIMASPSIDCSSTITPGMCEWKTTLAGTAAKFLVTFDGNDRVTSILVSGIASSDFGQVAEGLKSKFGNPSGSRTVSVSNLAGATFKGKELTWRLAASTLVATERASMAEASVLLATDAATRDAGQARKRAAESDM